MTDNNQASENQAGRPGAKAIGELLAQVESSLRFFSEAGCPAADLGPEGVNILKAWDKPDCLRPKPTHTPVPMPTKIPTADPAVSLSECKRCPRREKSDGPLAGNGPLSARLMFVAGWPLPEAARVGHPLAGPEGELLEKIISAMKLSPQDVYITHVVKCCVPGPAAGRQAPSSADTAACRVFLEQEISEVAPEIICVLGEFATDILLNGNLTALRGRFHDYHGISVMPTWHPADIISRQDKKRDVWNDVQQIMAALNIHSD